MLSVVMVIAATIATTLSLVFLFKPAFLSPNPSAVPDTRRSSALTGGGEAIYVPLHSPILLTYLSGGRTHYVKLEFSLMSRNPEIERFVELHKDRLRHEWLMALQQIPFKGLLTSAGKTTLQSQALAVAQAISNEEGMAVKIEQVLFTQFIIQ